MNDHMTEYDWKDLDTIMESITNRDDIQDYPMTGIQQSSFIKLMKLLKSIRNIQQEPKEVVEFYWKPSPIQETHIVDPKNPINKDHPLNKGLIAAWIEAVEDKKNDT